MNPYTQGEQFLKRKPKKVNGDLAIFIIFLMVMAVLFYKIVFPMYFPPKNVAIAPVENVDLCKEVMDGKWSTTAQVFLYCQKLEAKNS